MLWGEDLICGEFDLRDKAIALTYVAVLKLVREALEAVAEDFPHLQQKLRAASQRIRLVRCIFGFLPRPGLDEDVCVCLCVFAE